MNARRMRAGTVAAVVTSIVLVAAPVLAAFPGSNGKIIYRASDGMHTINPNGTGDVLLLPGVGDASFSASGLRIVYIRNGDIYTADSNGGTETFVFDLGGDSASSPSFSPDGGRVVFQCFTTGTPDICVVNADGTGFATIVASSQNDLTPKWGPGGTRIVFARSGNDLSLTGIWTVSPDGSSPRLVYHPAAYGAGNPSWSPDGQMLAFAAGSGRDIFAIRTDGTGLRNISNTPDRYESYPSWSPDGSQLLYYAAFGLTFRFAIANSDGSGEVAVVPSTGMEPADWQSLGCTVRGTAGSDILNGTSGRDRICGLGGNDTIYGRGGADVLLGGSGNDTIYGGSGNDRLVGDSGTDRLFGQSGADTLVAVDLVSSNDTLNGGAGVDSCHQDPGDTVGSC